MESANATPDANLQLTQDELASVKKLQDSYSALKRELSKVIGPVAGHGRAADRPLLPRPLPDRRRAWPGQGPRWSPPWPRR